MNSYVKAFHNFANFSGRATRTDFWLWQLIYLAGIVLMFVVDAIFGTFDMTAGIGLFSAIFMLVHFIPGISIFIRRIHDADRSGWWALTLLIPFLGIIAFIVLACLASTPGANRFGKFPGDSGRPEATDPAPDSPAGSSDIPLDQLERISQLRSSGAISEDEFAAMKGRVLGNS